MPMSGVTVLAVSPGLTGNSAGTPHRQDSLTDKEEIAGRGVKQRWTPVGLAE